MGYCRCEGGTHGRAFKRLSIAFSWSGIMQNHSCFLGTCVDILDLSVKGRWVMKGRLRAAWEKWGRRRGFISMVCMYVSDAEVNPETRYRYSHTHGGHSSSRVTSG